MGPFELNWETQQYKCWISQYITFSLLAALQAMNLFWLFLILRIAKNYVISNVKKDERSDNEDDEEEEASEQPEKQSGAGSEAITAHLNNVGDKSSVSRRNTGKENGHANGQASSAQKGEFIPNGKKNK